MNNFTFDRKIDQATPENIRKLLISTTVFSDQEIEVAMELVRETLDKGSEKSGYHYVTARDDSGNMAGFACFGPVPFTVSGFDLYWIAVHSSYLKAGLGKKIYLEVEREIISLGGQRIYAETSGRDVYLPARKFYENTGFIPVCRLKDFYAPGDDKIIFEKKHLNRTEQNPELTCASA